MGDACSAVVDARPGRGLSMVDACSAVNVNNFRRCVLRKKLERDIGISTY